jgi:hypothetical protein
VQPDQLPSVETRLLQVLAGIAVVATLGVLAILPWRLYSRDIRHAQVEAHRTSRLVHAALAEALREGRDTTDLVNRLQAIADLDIRLERIEGDAQVASPAASELHGTELSVASPPILDGRGSGWLARMHFDLAPMKRESVRLIIDLVLAVILGSAVFSAVVFLLVRRSIVAPLRRVTDALQRASPGDRDAGLPGAASRELAELVGAVERARREPRPGGAGSD